MNTTKFKQEILQNAVQMDASVNFQLNGNMLIVPCPWEEEKYGLTLTKALYQEESDEIMAYLKTRKEEPVW